MTTQEEKVKYINDNQEIPAVLDGALGAILENKAGASKEEVLKCLAQYALMELSPAASAKVATASVPNFALASQNAESLTNFSSVAHNLNQPIFGGGAEPISAVSPTSTPSGAKPAEFPSDAEEQVARTHLARRGTIVKYNMTLPGRKHSVEEVGSAGGSKSALEEEEAEARLRRLNNHLVKTVVTVGPSCNNVVTLRGMIRRGMTVARLNLSHGTLESHQTAVKNVREAARLEEAHVSIAVDSRGSAVRLGLAHDSGDGVRKITKHQIINLSTDPKYKEQPSVDTMFIDWANACEGAIAPGQRVCIADGLLTLRVRSIESDEEGKYKFLACIAENDFELGHRKNVNLPGVVVDVPILNVAKPDFDFALAEKIDIIFLSLVQSGEDVKVVRASLKERGLEAVSIIAKIENQAGLQALDEIVHASDGIMVSRGALGSELPIQKLFVVQKLMIAKANVAGKPVIVSSQLLVSMCNNSQPTRAEANDVANAVLDGADCLMLSAETATGAHPVIATQVLGEISFEAQRFMPRAHLFRSMVALQPRPMPDEEAVASSVVNSAMELGLKAIITLTTTGSSARSLSKYHPPCPIVAVCKTELVYNQLNLVRAVIPFRYDGVEADEREVRLEKGEAFLKDTLKLVKAGDMIAFLHADVNGPVTGYANVCRVVVIQ